MLPSIPVVMTLAELRAAKMRVSSYSRRSARLLTDSARSAARSRMRASTVATSSSGSNGLVM